MNFTDRLHDEVADVRADAGTLARTALADGQRHRRRRRTLGAATAGLAAAAVAGIVIVSTVLPGGTAPDQAGPATSPTAAPSAATTEPTAGTAPITGRMTVAALQDAIDALPESLALTGSVVPGTIAGSGDDGYAGVETYGQFGFETAEGRTELGVNVQRSPGTTGAMCPPRLLECEAAWTPEGDLVRTFRLDDGKDLSQRFAELLSDSRGLRVVIASNVPVGDPEPVSFAQLAGIVGWSTWGLELPEEYVAKGDALPSYDEV